MVSKVVDSTTEQPLTIGRLERELERFKRLIYVAAGGVIVLGTIPLLTLMLRLPPHPTDPGFSWFLVWLGVELGAILAGVYLLSGKWRQLPLHLRKGTAMGFLGIGWLALLAFVIWLIAGGAEGGFILWVVWVWIGSGVGLVWLHRRLGRNRRVGVSETAG